MHANVNEGKLEEPNVKLKLQKLRFDGFKLRRCLWITGFDKVGNQIGQGFTNP